MTRHGELRMQAETIAEAVRGGEEACRELFESWYPRAYRIAKSICLNRAGAEDAVQEALIRLWRVLPRLGEPATADRYFYRTVANEARRLLSRQRHAETELRGFYGESGDPTGDDLADARAALRKAVERLPEKLRSAILLHYFGGFGEAETAELLGASLSAVKMRLLRGRQRLRTLLEQWGYEVTEE